MLDELLRNPVVLLLVCLVCFVLLALLVLGLYTLSNRTVAHAQLQLQPEPASDGQNLAGSSSGGGGGDEPATEPPDADYDDDSDSDEEDIEIPELRIEIKRSNGEVLVITCDAAELSIENHYVGIEWSNAGYVTITGEAGEVLSEFDSDDEDVEVAESWSDVISLLCFANKDDTEDGEEKSVENEDDDDTGFPEDWEPNQIFTLDLSDGRKIRIELENFDEKYQGPGYFAIDTESYGYVRVTEVDTVRIFDSDEGRVVLLYTDVIHTHMEYV